MPKHGIRNLSQFFAASARRIELSRALPNVSGGIRFLELDLITSGIKLSKEQQASFHLLRTAAERLEESDRERIALQAQTLVNQYDGLLIISELRSEIARNKGDKAALRRHRSAFRRCSKMLSEANRADHEYPELHLQTSTS